MNKALVVLPFDSNNDHKPKGRRYLIQYLTYDNDMVNPGYQVLVDAVSHHDAIARSHDSKVVRKAFSRSSIVTRPLHADVAIVRPFYGGGMFPKRVAFQYHESKDKWIDIANYRLRPLAREEA